MDLTRSSIEKIEELTKPVVLPEINEFPGKVFSTKKIYEVRPKEKQPDKLYINTLAGIVDYLKNNLDDELSHTIVIESPIDVVVYGNYDVLTESRPEYIQASFGYKGYQEGFSTQESFIIEVLSKFVNNEERESLLSLAGSISDKSEVKLLDDGISQSVSTKSGIQRISDVEIKNPITLKPFVTFPDIEQPEKLYNFRINSAHVIQMALISCDGDLWKIKAIKSIKEYLLKELKDVKVSIIA